MAITPTEIEIRRRIWDKKFQKELRKYFNNLRKGVEEAESFSQLQLQVNLLIDKSNLTDVLYKLWIGCASDFGKFTYNRLKNQKSFSLLEFGIISYIQGVVFQRVTKINTFSKIFLARILNRAYDDGLSIPNTVKEIRNVFKGWSKWRATKIARTEVVSASNYGSLQGAKQTGQGLMKTWIATFDSRTRKTHKKAHGQVVGMDEKFKVGNAELEFPGDPQGPAKEVINCRCAIGYKEVE